MAKGVEILNVTKISLPPLPETPPPLKLSLLDSIWISYSPLQKLMLYPNTNTNLSFPSLLELLKSSLSATLADYLPLAGKLTYVPSTGDVEIDFSDPHVTFVEAESELDLNRLATSEIHDVDSFKKLVPPLDVSVLPFHVFAVQVTRFDCGGIAIGYSYHHAIVDGKALLQFMNAWTGSCSTAKINGVARPVEGCRPPIYDRSVIKHPKGEEIARGFLRTIAPALPNTRISFLESMGEDGLHSIRRTFTLDAQSIKSLKQQATRHEPATVFSAISAHVWACIVRTKSFDPNEDAFFSFPMDCRARLNPPVDESYFGPCGRVVSARTTVSKLLAQDGLARASEAIRNATREAAKDPLRDCQSWIADFTAMPFERVVNVSASPKFRAYDADFGWGRPGRFEAVSMNYDAEFALVAGREEGTVQVSVSLDRDQMDTFAEFFWGGFDSKSNLSRVKN